MAGMEIVSDRASKEGNTKVAFAVADAAAKKGLWAQLATMASFGGVFRIAPPITTSEDELEEGLSILEEAFAETEGTVPLYSEMEVVSQRPDL